MPDSNTPRINLTAALDPASLQWWIEYEYSQHAAAIDALMERFSKFCFVTAAGIPDDYMAGVSADFAHELKQTANALDDTRTRIKRPVLHAQRQIDGTAKKLTDRLTAAVAEVETRITAYLKIKEQEARARAQAEADRLRAEAEQRAAEALRQGATEAETAVEAFDAADKAQELANARGLELTRTRGVGGALTALKDNWTYEVTDIAKVPTAYLVINDALVRAMLKTGVRDLPGLRIYNEPKAYVR